MPTLVTTGGTTPPLADDVSQPHSSKVCVADRQQIFSFFLAGAAPALADHKRATTCEVVDVAARRPRATLGFALQVVLSVLPACFACVC